MSWIDAIALASRSIGRRLGRAVLTVLAVGLAAALLSSLLIASSAARRRVLDQVSNGGPLAGIEVAAAAPDPGALDSDDPPRGDARDIDDAALRRIERLPGVASVVPITASPAFIVRTISTVVALDRSGEPPSRKSPTSTGCPIFLSAFAAMSRRKYASSN